MADFDEGGLPDNVSLLRILSDVQALLAAQRRIEWKITGLSKAQLAVNGSLEDVKQDMRDIRSRLAGGAGADVETPRNRPRSTSRTALAIRSLARSKSMAGTPKSRAEDDDGNTQIDSGRQRPPNLDLDEKDNRPLTPRGASETPRSSSPRGGGAITPRPRGQNEEEVLRLRRDDERMFVQVGKWKKTWGTARTSTECRLPGLEVKASEDAGRALERLLEGRLGVLSRGIELTGQSEKAVLVREFKRFRMTNTKRYNQTIYDAVLDVSFRVPRQCIAATGGSFTTPWRTRGPVGVPEQDIIALWHEGVVYLFSWLTVEELEYFASPQGDNTLSQWIATSVIDEEALQKVISL